MSELVERYIHQVGRLLPKKERAEIEAELRSMIEDQLEDRFAGSPSQADVAAVLMELGSPHQMATSYRSEQYLIGPDLYPYMMGVLRHGWLIVPSIVIFMNLFGGLVLSDETGLADLFLQTIGSTVQAILIFSAVVVLIFALIQRYGEVLFKELPAFDPLELPEVNDPSAVDRYEAIFGVVFGTFMTLVFFYFLRVGGLTLHFNVSDPGEVIPVSSLWLFIIAIVIFAMVIMELLVLRRNRWNAFLWMLETLLEVIGGICLYFVLYVPLLERLGESNPDLAGLVNLAEVFVVIGVSATLITRNSTQVRLWNYSSNSRTPNGATSILFSNETHRNQSRKGSK